VESQPKDWLTLHQIKKLMLNHNTSKASSTPVSSSVKDAIPTPTRVTAKPSCRPIPVAAAVPDGIIGQLQRIKLSREKGAKLPLGTVVVTRGPGRKWGNPFEIDVDGSRSEVIAKYKNWLTTDPKGMETLKAAKEKLRGKNLACSCDLDEECHGDFLLKMVNEVAPST
jgi:hypothetical protein